MQITKPLPSDASQRKEALSPERSFIVQAPAGSGKTELLIQRFLVLLAQVEHPEEVVAITFTRKATGEMRLRIVEALQRGQSEQPPAQAHQRNTWELARKINQRDQERGWHITASPSRLRIQTFDAFCSAIIRHQPWLSGLGGQARPKDDPYPLYEQAAWSTLARLDPPLNSPHSKAAAGHNAATTALLLRVLLSHRDNNLTDSAKLLCTMLAKRDQWLRYIRKDDPKTLRQVLENVLATINRTQVTKAQELLLRTEAAQTLPSLLSYAAQNLPNNKADHPLTACAELCALPEEHEVQAWKGLVALLLTTKGEWRKKIDKNIGFPAKTSQKNAMTALLKDLKKAEALREALREVQNMPPLVFSDPQWEVAKALLHLLPLAVEELERVFARKGELDYIQLSSAALTALEQRKTWGEDGVLDFSVRHLLVDEFQDTSHSQFVLLQQLTRNWKEGDGRTLFLVGDPMQSIYRFREADVSLYLQVRRKGMGALSLHPLHLSANFRSQEGIVTWLNEAFQQVFPAEENALLAAVPYSACHAQHPPGAEPAVRFYPQLEQNDAEEAEQVLRLVKKAQRRDPTGTVAILVRSRNHLEKILPALKKAQVLYAGVELQNLAARPAVRDLVALTRALHHPADRVAWLALLRAPWCGLELAQLEHLVQQKPAATLWDCICATESLPANLQPRLTRLREVLGKALALRGEGLRPLVEGCWLALGGPATLDAQGLEDTQVFLDLLETMDEEGLQGDLTELERRMTKLYAPPHPEAGEALQVMTIHKAKGLEFDTVILPGLGRSSPSSEASLLLWREWAEESTGENTLLLAPIGPTGVQEDKSCRIYRFLKQIHDKQEKHEAARLLYVAITRAREQVHLLGHCTLDQEGVPKVRKNALLARLWPAVKDGFDANDLFPESSSPPQEKAAGAANLFRLTADWERPDPPHPVPLPSPQKAEQDHKPKAFTARASETNRKVGIVVHAALQRLAEQIKGGRAQDEDAAQQVLPQRELVQLGVPEEELKAATTKAQQALTKTLADPEGSWLLQPHQDSHCELALTALLDGKIESVVIDRTFVDDKGIRWIVDYKTGQDGENEQESQYRKQLERYGRIMRLYDPEHPIQLALYFPLSIGLKPLKPSL